MLRATRAARAAREAGASVLLPRTSLPMRANAAKREPGFHGACVTDLWRWQQAARADAPAFTLHDGPPYANGSLHIGHLLNKVLKDFANRYQLSRGRRVEFVPGWDCHGLPIELKALVAAGADARDLGPREVRRLARQLAEEAVAAQRADFQRWGVLADWEDVYVTMRPEYEARQLGVFGAMVEQGLVHRGRKPVYWSPSSRTALAEAELEYQDAHVSQAAHVRFPAADPAAVVPALGVAVDAAVAWTTTPWTLPANEALCLNASVEYAAVRVAGGEVLLVAAALADSLPVAVEAVLGTAPGAALVGASFLHPLRGDGVAVLLGEHVTTEAGTGVVHTAPAHGQDDFAVWAAAGRSCDEARCPVDDEGRFTAEAGPGLAGLAVQTEGTEAVLAQLRAAGALLHVEPFEHRYPYDWRTKQPVIVRATEQWFASLGPLHGRAHAALEEVRMVPESGRRRLQATIGSRDEWCISRQRCWGVPIPVFYDAESGEPLLTRESIAHVQALVAEHGSDCWWELPVEELLPAAHRGDGRRYVRGEDTMDVWFDSGCSWAALPLRGGVADLYLEGSDQHRGWFQSSLLTSVAAQGAAPYRAVVTHGFVLDEAGAKMSKSLGNVVSPQTVITGGDGYPAYGADVLRLWAASIDYTRDVAIGPTVLAKTSEAMRRLRNTLRFALGNLAGGFEPVPEAELRALDRHALRRLRQVMCDAARGYDEHHFSAVHRAAVHFAAADLSAFYFAAVKDRLYCEPAGSAARRGCQTVLREVCVGLTQLLAPVTCHLAAEVADVMQRDGHGEVNFYDLPWPAAGDVGAEVPGMAAALEVRAEVNRLVEAARADGVLAQSTEAVVVLPESGSLPFPFPFSDEELAEMFVVARVERSTDFSFSGEAAGVSVGVRRSELHKCERCWRALAEEEGGQCGRCLGVASV